MQFGFALFCTWMYIAFFSPILLDDAAAQALGRHAHVLPSSLSNALSLLIIAALDSKLGPYAARRLTAVLLSLAGGLGTFLVYVGSGALGNALGEAGGAIVGISSPLVLVGAILTGIGSGWVVALWGEVYSSLADGDSAAHILCSNIIGIGLYVLFMLIPRSVAAFLACLLLPACGALAVRASHGCDDIAPLERPDSRSHWVRRVWRILLALFTFGVVFWSSPLLSGDRPIGAAVVIGSGVLAVLVVVVDMFVTGHLSMRIVYRIVLPLMLVGVLMAFVFPESTPGPLLAMAAFTCLDYFAYVTYAHSSHATGFPPAASFALGHSVEALSIPIGWLLSTYVIEGLRQAAGEAGMVLAMAIVLVVVCGIVIADGAGDAGDGGDADDEDAPSREQTPILSSAELFARQCETTIARYGLSEREEQVMLMVSRGRSIPFIARKMHLSTSTIKTHMRHLYEKLGVSDRQEMLDLIEAIEPEP